MHNNLYFIGFDVERVVLAQKGKHTFPIARIFWKFFEIGTMLFYGPKPHLCCANSEKDEAYVHELSLGRSQNALTR